MIHSIAIIVDGIKKKKSRLDKIIFGFIGSKSANNT